MIWDSENTITMPYGMVYVPKKHKNIVNCLTYLVNYICKVLQIKTVAYSAVYYENYSRQHALLIFVIVTYDKILTLGFDIDNCDSDFTFEEIKNRVKVLDWNENE